MSVYTTFAFLLPLSVYSKKKKKKKMLDQCNTWPESLSVLQKAILHPDNYIWMGLFHLASYYSRYVKKFCMQG